MDLDAGGEEEKLSTPVSSLAGFLFVSSSRGQCTLHPSTPTNLLLHPRNPSFSSRRRAHQSRNPNRTFFVGVPTPSGLTSLGPLLAPVEVPIQRSECFYLLEQQKRHLQIEASIASSHLPEPLETSRAMDVSSMPLKYLVELCLNEQK